MSGTEEKVRGIDKLFPTSRARLLFWAIPTSALAIFWQAPKLVPLLFKGLPQEHGWIGISLLIFFVVAVSSLLLVIELCVYASQNEHRVTRHYKYSAPEMNVKWLLTNFRHKHYLFLFGLILIGFCLGKIL
ncbi:hypothetical protein [uncultured Microbulbifer sp.]|uniref:hypothetical protein n=1 Tax=uncultured Microbulbifer sp. TaxID=348147 RepID=UPI002631C776|nr:hypothetical protein [uncultured Microbulbifer sp.]